MRDTLLHVMPLSDDDYNHHSAYFGVWSAAQTARVSELLESLGVRYKFVVEVQSEERLRNWTAWDLSFGYTMTISTRLVHALSKCTPKESSARHNSIIDCKNLA